MQTDTTTYKLSVRSTAEEVARLLRSRIHSGEFSPGDRFPSERDLAITLSVARPTLREALKILQGEGYITTRRGVTGGTFVSELEMPYDQWLEKMRRNIEDFEDIFDFRIAIEMRAATLAAQRRDDEDLAVMEAAVERMLMVDSRSSFRQADAQFHNAVAHAARNLRLKQAITAARGELFIPTDRLVYKELVNTSYHGHRAVYDAIRRSDAVAAAAAMEAHIEQARRELHMVLSKETP
ncbi:MAG: FadR/GntR family transcriptional regulator [Anaerolineae bacterium]